MGYAMAMTRFDLDAAALFAWVAVCLLVVAVVELILVKPLTGYLRSWRITDKIKEAGMGE
ncbi:MAG TPA: hypothetical protein DCQ14_04005 [Firmicutes bacterium]|nr:hypothetical protein [Bacillota bacterium]